MTYVHHSMRQKAAPPAADVAAPDAAAVAQRRQHLESALTALRLLLEGNPRLSALMASRPALAPLLDCVEPSARCAALRMEVFVLKAKHRTCTES